MEMLLPGQGLGDRHLLFTTAVQSLLLPGEYCIALRLFTQYHSHLFRKSIFGDGPMLKRLMLVFLE